MNKLGALLCVAVAAYALPSNAEGISQAKVSQNDVTGAIGNEARSLQTIPSLDLMHNCTRAFTSKEAAGDCITREKLAQKQINAGWASLAPRVQRICLMRVPQGVARAYGSLADCVLKEGRLDKMRTVETQR